MIYFERKGYLSKLISAEGNIRDMIETAIYSVHPINIGEY